jgi:hypothetical protein
MHALGLLHVHALSLDELTATAGRIVGLRNLPHISSRDIHRILRPLLLGHTHDLYRIRSVFRDYDRTRALR